VAIPEGGTDSFFDVLYTQRAIRKFKPDPVPPELLKRVVEAGTKAPSGSNRQPWAFIVVEDAGTRQKIADAVRERIKADEQTWTFFNRGAASEDRSERLIYTGALSLVENLAQAPAFIIPCLYPAGNSLLAGSSIYPAVQNLMLAARALGLGTVLTTFNARIEPFVEEILGLPAEAKSVALIPIGYPDAKFGPTKRKPVEEVLYWGKWGAVRD
jgi:nitroreductase